MQETHVCTQVNTAVGLHGLGCVHRPVAAPTDTDAWPTELWAGAWTEPRGSRHGHQDARVQPCAPGCTHLHTPMDLYARTNTYS